MMKRIFSNCRGSLGSLLKIDNDRNPLNSLKTCSKPRFCSPKNCSGTRSVRILADTNCSDGAYRSVAFCCTTRLNCTADNDLARAA